ncbi:MAG: hypothetical protein ACMUIA_06260 [bacterium]
MKKKLAVICIYAFILSWGIFNPFPGKTETGATPDQDGKETPLSVSNIPPDKITRRSIESKVYKYMLKLDLWERRGYIKKFNELARARGSFLTNNIAEARAKLRQERQKATDGIHYGREAENFLKKRALNDILKEWGIDLVRLPQRIDVQKAVVSSRILDFYEDETFIGLSLDLEINTHNLRKQLLDLGYQFSPIRVQLHCPNLFGETRERFLDAVMRRSEYMKNQSEGLYEIYSSVEAFASELEGMVIGAYTIHLDQVADDLIVFSVKSNEK